MSGAVDALGGGRQFTLLPPLSLYVHLPWCVSKCPYCDFNSHELRGEIPETAYVDALLADLADELPLVWGRSLVSVFIGGGTPSLFSAGALDRLLCGIRALMALPPGIEITLEANPGTVEQGRFDDFRAIGINRLSIGVQSLDDRALAALGRIHSAQEARRAVDVARRAGFDNLNLDLMYGLPDQSPAAARSDLDAVLALEPEHLSCYELTLEPNTAFAARPPALPDDETRWDMQAALLARMTDSGFERYEISAFAKPGRRSVHNVNYWQFGDYLGIGAGAHGKLSFADSGSIRRRSKVRHPRRYLLASGSASEISIGPASDDTDGTVTTRLAGDQAIAVRDSGIEFMMNALRLVQGFDIGLFEAHTGVSLHPWSAAVNSAIDDELLRRDGARLVPTTRGLDLLNTLLQRFMPDDTDRGAGQRTAWPVIPLTLER